MIKSEITTLHDKSRNRDIPVKTYFPAESNGHTVVFSHGLGGSCESYKYIGEFLAAHGFTSIHPTHIGIDAWLLTQKRPLVLLKEAGEARINAINCPLDIKFILDEMKLSNICMAGHSYGSYTTFALAGQDVSKLGEDMDFKDSRVKCAIALSPHVVLQNPEHAYDEIEIPILHVTGKLDNSPFGFFEPEQRRIPFDNIHNKDQYLITFEWADHMVFAAQRRGNKFSAKDIAVMKLTCEASLEFLKKYLLNTNSAIDTTEFADRLTATGSFEKK